MKINLNYIITAMAALVIGMIVWNIYLVDMVKTLEKKVFKTEEKYHYLESYNEILQYDLVTARDSVRLLKKEQ